MALAVDLVLTTTEPEGTLPMPTCIHGNDLGTLCPKCEDLIAEEVRRKVWIDGLVRMTDFFIDNPELIPSLGAMVHIRRTADAPTARTAVFDFIEAAGPVIRDDYFLQESKVESQAFGPHSVSLIVRNDVIGKNVTKPTDVWEWDEAMFGAAEAEA